MAERAYRLIK